mmetsp:Transcript_1101/g.2359  ORF Transcript_1101/g.2359 Transcript_1101/m.2359 type:complete len:305 (+) Transcript_1101:190-1104(+)
MGRQIGKGNNINVVDDDDSDSVGSAIFPPMITRTKSGRELFNAINTTGSSSRRRRSQSVHIRSNNGEVAMSRRDRVSAQFRNFLNRFKTSSDGNDDSRVSNAGDPERGTRYTEDKRQYHLIPPKRNQSFCFCVRRGVGFGALSDIKPNEHLASFLHWTFRSSFVVLIFFMCLCFFGLIVGFAFLITAAGRMNEDCVRAGGDPASNFADAFALSWTTFSTVSVNTKNDYSRERIPHSPPVGQRNALKEHFFFLRLDTEARIPPSVMKIRVKTTSTAFSSRSSALWNRFSGFCILDYVVQYCSVRC